MKGGSAALAAMIRKKSVVLYGSPGGETLDGTSTSTMADNSPEPEASKPPKYQPSTTPFSGANKCYICSKTVYKTEEIIAVGHCWHANCFTCGGSNDDGCKRTLRRDGYTDHNSQPYCTACSSKLFKPKGFGYGNTLNLDSGVPAAEAVLETPKKAAPAEEPPTPPAAVTPEPPKPLPTPILKEIKSAVQAKEDVKPVKYTPKVVNMAFNSTPKCTICAKSVYKMEEMVAVGRVWHLNCFTCGGSSTEGCKRVLKRDGYVDHENNPFCTTCHNKLYRPKGFGYGNTLNTDYGPVAHEDAAAADTATAQVTADVAKVAVTASAPAPLAPARSFKSSAGLASAIAANNAAGGGTPQPSRPAHDASPVASPAAAPVPAPVPTPVAAPAPASPVISKPAAPPAPAPAPPPAPAPVPAPVPAAAPKAAAKPAGRSSFTGDLPVGVTAPAGGLAIGASSRSAGAVFQEASYVGDNDEVDENEW